MFKPFKSHYEKSLVVKLILKKTESCPIFIVEDGDFSEGETKW